jgi:hypothetical protein
MYSTFGYNLVNFWFVMLLLSLHELLYYCKSEANSPIIKFNFYISKTPYLVAKDPA